MGAGFQLQNHRLHPFKLLLRRLIYLFIRKVLLQTYGDPQCSLSTVLGKIYGVQMPAPPFFFESVGGYRRWDSLVFNLSFGMGEIGVRVCRAGNDLFWHTGTTKVSMMAFRAPTVSLATITAHYLLECAQRIRQSVAFLLWATLNWITTFPWETVHPVFLVATAIPTYVWKNKWMKSRILKVMRVPCKTVWLVDPNLNLGQRLLVMRLKI